MRIRTYADVTVDTDYTNSAMKTEFKRLTPGQAWEEAVGRSLAIGVAGWAVVGCLQAAGAIPALYQPWLAPASSLVASFLTALALFVAYYHNHWRVGICLAVITLCLPYAANLLWIRFSVRSLVYPLATVFLVGVVGSHFVHRKYSGPTLAEDAELAIIEKMMADYKPTWVDRATAICFIVGFVLFLILLLR